MCLYQLFKKIEIVSYLLENSHSPGFPESPSPLSTLPGSSRPLDNTATKELMSDNPGAANPL